MKRQCAYKKIIVIGYGIVARGVLKALLNKQLQYKFEIEYMIYERSPIDVVERYARAHGIKTNVYMHKDELVRALLNDICHEKTLIISANNYFIFPRVIVDNENVRIVNFHNALLPEYPGRNAASWVIYEGEQETGITWHYVDSTIDGGNIIAQRKCIIPDDVRAYELAAKLMKLAVEVFEEYEDSILCNMIKTKKQELKKERRVYKSSDIPGNGSFKLTDAGDYIYRLLRAMDYGKYNIFPHPKTKYKGKEVIVKKYNVVSDQTRDLDDEACVVLSDLFLRLYFGDIQ